MTPKTARVSEKARFNKPQIMGVINATPDSFSDGNTYMDVNRARDRIHIMRKNGVNIIDIGGESKRPGSMPISESEEIRRVLPVLEAATESFPNLVYSIDTTKYEVAKQALKLGANIINDVSGLRKDARLADLAAEYDATLIIMHSKGEPRTMQDNPSYTDVVQEVYDFFMTQCKAANSRGAQKIILDPGIGFGKNLEQNLKILAHLNKFVEIGYPVMIGASRKSMIGDILDNRPVDDRVIGTVSIHYDALVNGARVLRVHDVKQASDSVRIFNAIQSQR